jgi:hypothetical protein
MNENGTWTLENAVVSPTPIDDLPFKSKKNNECLTKLLLSADLFPRDFLHTNPLLLAKCQAVQVETSARRNFEARGQRVGHIGRVCGRR